MNKREREALSKERREEVELRSKRGESTKAIAAAIGLSPGYVSQMLGSIRSDEACRTIRDKIDRACNRVGRRQSIVISPAEIDALSFKLARLEGAEEQLAALIEEIQQMVERHSEPFWTLRYGPRGSPDAYGDVP